MVKPHTSNMAYRADVDGLRAFAVLSVILFHVDPAWAPGGFIGVDVFFVISGFLITGVITKERQAGTFTYAEFYRRRIKRLFPVLFTVIGVTLLAGQIILNEADNERLVTSAVASAFFAANIFFTYSLDAGYFASDAAFEPLLHLWSLGVEEQFYIVWPAVIGIAGAGWVTRRSGVAIMAVLALLSFVLARLVVVDHPMFAYYMLPTRAGELLLGAIAFALIHNGAAARVSRAGREALSWGGAAAIAWSVIYLNEESLFPGVTAIPATAGAAAIILAGAPGATSLGRLLALRPIVWVGLLSYSLYLWHWPVLAYAKYMHGELALDYRIAALAVIFALSAGSYFLIEKPVRRSRAGLGRLAMLGFAAPTAAVALVAAGVLATNGYSWRA